MEQITKPEPETAEKSAVELFGSIMGKVMLGLLLVFLIFAGISSLHAPAMHYTGGGAVTISVPVGSTSCMLTVKQDDGNEHTYEKITAPLCTGFSVGKRVHITDGVVD